MAEDNFNFKLKFNPDTRDALKSIQDLEASVARLNEASKQAERQMEQMGSTTFKRGQATQNNLSNMAGSVNSTYSNFVNNAKMQQGTAITQNNPQMAQQMNAMIQQATQLMSRSMGQAFDKITHTINPTQLGGYSKVNSLGGQGSMTSVPRNVAQGMDTDERIAYQQRQGRVAAIKNSAAAVTSSYSAGAMRENKAVNQYTEQGKVSYQRDREVTALFKTTADAGDVAKSSLKEANEKLEYLAKDLDKQAETAKSIADGLEKQKAAQGGLSDEQEKELQAQKRITAGRQAEAAKIREGAANFSTKQESRIKNADEALSGAQKNYTEGRENGTIKRGFDPNSMMGRISSRSNAIMMAAGASATNAVTGAFERGGNLRVGMENDINSISLVNPNIAGKGGRADNRLTNALGVRSVHNGTNYDPTTMAQMAATYSQTTGDTSNDTINAASQISKMARFGNMGVDTATALTAAIGGTGAASKATNGSGSNFSNLKEITDTITGSISGNKLQGQAQEQSAGITSILNTMSANGQALNKNSVGNASEFYNALGKDNPNLRGQQGANVVNQMTQGFYSASTSDPTLRAAFAGGNMKYAGPVGQAQLTEDMQNMWDHPDNVKSAFNNMRSLQGGNTKLASEQMSKRLGLSMSTTEDIYKEVDNNTLSKESLARLRDKDSKKNPTSGAGAKKASATYKAQGNSTLDLKIVITDNGDIKTSEVADTTRSLSNGAKGTGGFLSSMVSGLGSTVGNMGGNLLSWGVNSLALKGLGAGARKLAATKVGQKFIGSKAVQAVTKSKPAQWASKLFGWGGNTSKAAKTATTAAEDVAKSSGKAGLFSRMFKGTKGVAAKVLTKVPKVGKIAGAAAAVGAGAKGLFGKVFKKGTGKVTNKATAKVAEKATAKAAEKAAGKTALKVAGKGAAKVGLTASGIGTLPGLAWDAYDAVGGIVDIAKHPIQAWKNKGNALASLGGVGQVGKDKKGLLGYGFDFAKKIGGGVSSLFGKSKFGKGVGKFTEMALDGPLGIFQDKKVTSAIGKGAKGVAGFLGKGVKGAGSLLGKAGKAGSKLLSKVGLGGVAKVGGKLLGKAGSKLIPGVGLALGAYDAFNGVKDISKDPGNALKHPFKSIGSLLGLTKVNDKSSKSKSKGKKGDTTKSEEENITTRKEKLNREMKDRIKEWGKLLDKAEKVMGMSGTAKADSSSSSDKDKDNDSDGDLGNIEGKDMPEKMKNLAKALGKKTGIDPSLIYAQLGIESGNFTSPESVNDLNFAGIKGSGGGMSPEGDTYAKFNSVGDFGKEYLRVLNKFNDDTDGGLAKAKTPAEYAHALRNTKSGQQYYTATEADYTTALQSYVNQFGHASGGIFSQAHVAKVAEGNRPEAIIPFDPSRRDEAKSLLSRSAGALGMTQDLNNTNTSNTRNNNNVTLSPNYQISITGTSNETAEQLRSIAQKASEDMTRETQAQMMNFYGQVTVNG